jgi:hypothetical protein
MSHLMSKSEASSPWRLVFLNKNGWPRAAQPNRKSVTREWPCQVFYVTVARSHRVYIYGRMKVKAFYYCRRATRRRVGCRRQQPLTKNGYLLSPTWNLFDTPFVDEPLQ